MYKNITIIMTFLGALSTQHLYTMQLAHSPVYSGKATLNFLSRNIFAQFKQPITTLEQASQVMKEIKTWDSGETKDFTLTDTDRNSLITHDPRIREAMLLIQAECLQNNVEVVQHIPLVWQAYLKTHNPLPALETEPSCAIL